MSQKVLFKFLLASMKTLILGILPEVAPESLPPPNETGGNSKGIVSLNSTFENADSQSIFYFLHNKAAKKQINYRCFYRKFKTFKKLFI
jgi:hypothetical protein